jgi:rSAM/selenodomain-associated transferase 2
VPPLVSIVVPARGDAAPLGALLAQIVPGTAAEVIVAVALPLDDHTTALRRQRPDVLWVESAPGRGRQLNAGAAQASGEWFWFVHADSRLPAGWLEAFRALGDDGRTVNGGAFRFALDSPAWQARLLERGVAWRVRWFDLPYGDQGIFVRRTVFHSLGGFAALPLLEDVEFIGRLKGLGRLRHLTLGLTTSARRWEREGWLRRSVKNLVILGLYRLGVPPERLARRYYWYEARSRGPDMSRDNCHADQETR